MWSQLREVSCQMNNSSPKHLAKLPGNSQIFMTWKRSHICAFAFMAKGAFAFKNFKILAFAFTAHALAFKKLNKTDNDNVFFTSGFEVKKLKSFHFLLFLLPNFRTHYERK
jgi:hypothetical protein